MRGPEDRRPLDRRPEPHLRSHPSPPAASYSVEAPDAHEQEGCTQYHFRHWSRVSAPHLSHRVKPKSIH